MAKGRRVRMAGQGLMHIRSQGCRAVGQQGRRCLGPSALQHAGPRGGHTGVAACTPTLTSCRSTRTPAPHQEGTEHSWPGPRGAHVLRQRSPARDRCPADSLAQRRRQGLHLLARECPRPRPLARPRGRSRPGVTAFSSQEGQGELLGPRWEEQVEEDLGGAVGWGPQGWTAKKRCTRRAPVPVPCPSTASLSSMAELSARRLPSSFAAGTLGATPRFSAPQRWPAQQPPRPRRGQVPRTWEPQVPPLLPSQVPQLCPQHWEAAPFGSRCWSPRPPPPRSSQRGPWTRAAPGALTSARSRLRL